MELLNHLLNTSLIIQHLFIIINALYGILTVLQTVSLPIIKILLTKYGVLYLAIIFIEAQASPLYLGIVYFESTERSFIYR